MHKQIFRQREVANRATTVRELSLRLLQDGTPASLSEEQRSVDLVAATETPVPVLDLDRFEIVDEVLLMSGAQFGERASLLDSHDRFDTSHVLGSVRDFRVEGDQLIGTAYFSSVDKGEQALTKVREGHLTDFSVGYTVNESAFVEEGTTATIDGREFTGPVRVTTSWTVKEVSIVPIGADEKAKARAVAQKQHTEDNMDPKLRAFLEKRGLPTDATDKQAWDFFERLDDGNPPSNPGHNTDPEPHRSEAAQQERQRISEIHALAKRFECEDLVESAINSGQDLDQFRAQVLDQVEKRKKAEPQPSFRAEMGSTEGEKFRDAAGEALLFRAGISTERSDSNNGLAGYTLRELAREFLVRSGSRVPDNPLEMIGRSLTTSDFPKILANTANKALMSGWEGAEETWDRWCGTGQVSDFKQHTMVRAGEMDDLKEIPEGAEYEYSAFSEAQEQYQIATYGRIFAITRQTIINDDLNALTDLPAKRGEAAARKIGDVAVAVLTANAAMGDGTALFHADHNNLLTGASLGVDSLGNAIKAMKLQKDIANKRRLNIRPRYFMAPVTLEAAGEQFFNTTLIGGKTNQPNLNNPYGGSYFERVYEPRLDDDSTKAWYLLGPRGKTVVLFFLNGIRTPYLETRDGWSVDGVEYKVRLDVGAKAVDWRAMTKNPGA